MAQGAVSCVTNPVEPPPTNIGQLSAHHCLHLLVSCDVNEQLLVWLNLSPAPGHLGCNTNVSHCESMCTSADVFTVA